MKRSTIYLLIIALASMLLGWGVVLVYRVFKSSMEPSVCICTVSEPASDQAAQALIKLLEQAILEKKGSLSFATQAVQKEFPYCTSISCRQQSSGLVQAHVEIDEPFCSVNDDMVMTTQGVVVLRTLYADEAVVGLPQLRITYQKEIVQTCLSKKNSSQTGVTTQKDSVQTSASKTVATQIDSSHADSSLSPYLLSFLRHIPDSLLSTHEIIYRSDDEIALVQRSTEQRTTVQRATAQREHVKPAVTNLAAAQSIAAQPIYLCAVDTVVDSDLLTRCDKAMADLEQQKTTSKKKARTAVVLDLRFDKHIILYPHMGGQVHG